MDNEKFIKKELEQVSAGKGNSVSDENDEEVKYCKYCNKETPQIFKGSGIGWDKDGHSWGCNLWECTICKNTNYWRLFSGKEGYII